MRKSDIYIRVLEFGRDNPGFTRGQLEEMFPDEWGWLRREIQHSKLFQADGPAGQHYYLSFEDRFKLLEYEELQEARKSAKRALWFAGVSLLIATASLLFQANTTLSTQAENNNSRPTVLVECPKVRTQSAASCQGGCS